jgi:hypothetical protein
MSSKEEKGDYGWPGPKTDPPGAKEEEEELVKTCMAAEA